MKAPKLLLVVIAIILILPLAGCDLIIQQLQSAIANITPQATLVVSRTGSLDVDIKGGLVSTKDGAEVEVPLGALGDRNIPISIEKDSTQEVSPPEGFEVGTVYQFEPDGTTFDQPVRISLPIPDDIDTASVLGMMTLDPATGLWVAIPGVVDEAKRIVSVQTTHFSPYVIYWPANKRIEATGGWIKVINRHVKGGDLYLDNKPGDTNNTRVCNGKPRTVGRGICFLTYNPDNPSNLVRPDSGQIYAMDEQTVKYWLPAGTYTIVEFEWSANINAAPLETPCQKWMTRPSQVITVTAGGTIVFGSDHTLPLPGDFTASVDGCTPGQSDSETPTPSGTTEAFVVVESGGGAMNGPTKPTTFTIKEAWTVTLIQTYHWNDGQGADLGTIALKAANGTVYGPWQAVGADAQGGVTNGFWQVRPNVVIPAGKYTVVDSDPATWSQNEDTGGRGMTWGYGIRQ